ncbi:DUF2834 domain-containing protein [Gordonia polyisoprenivorans]|uniref:DUF2834 domain-containing protein n=1 Tax=Gordonia polyisoprenivorans TaxID=84595 RepID=UPI001AD6EF16|nr:DUF2834 domain-containing protein [Gordonia polyisoprenivorans]QTI69502.1 DUF2834 domain-containing protein [Gordonia polyisoprenivorans]
MQWSRTERVYLLALAGGIVGPLVALAPWVAHNGLDLPLFVRELFATGVSSYFAVDVIIAVLILVTAAVLDDRLPRRSRILVGVVSLLGASAGLPAYLLLRARAQRLTAEKGSHRRTTERC